MTVTPQCYTYKTVGDLDIKADVYQPVDRSGPTAAIVYMHGGCLMYGSRGGLNPAQRDLYLEAGYAVISIDYRLAPESKLPAIIADMKDAFEWIGNSGPDLFSVDPQRIAAVGHSAGAYLALMSGCCAEPQPKAIISVYGYGDIVGDWYAKPDPFYCQQPVVSEEESGRNSAGPIISEPYEGRGKDKFYLYCRQNGLWPLEVGGRDPGEQRSFFTPYCPLQNVSADYPPTMLVHGDDDTDVPYEQSVLMDEELSRHEVSHEFLTLPGRGHGFDRDMDDDLVKDAFDSVLAFLERHIEGERG